MASRFLIYGLRDPRSGLIRYIGQSSRGLLRTKMHAKPSERLGNTYRARWLASLFAEGLRYEVVVLQYVRKRDLNAAETRWIADARRALGDQLTNHRDGGDQGDRPRPTEEQRARHAAIMRSPEMRAKMSQAKLWSLPRARVRLNLLSADVLALAKTKTRKLCQYCKTMKARKWFYETVPYCRPCMAVYNRLRYERARAA